MNYQEWYEKYIDNEQGIIDNFFDKHRKVQLKDITEQRISIINQAFKNDRIKGIALNTNIKSIQLGGNKAYHRSGAIVLKENYDKRTLIHEIGHAVDYENKWLSSFRDSKKAIQADKSNILSNQDIYQKLIKNNQNYRELSDILGGMTNNKIVGRYKHEKKYWKKTGKLEKEVFAQMFTMAGNDDIKQLEMFKKYLPNTFKEFDNIIRRLL